MMALDAQSAIREKDHRQSQCGTALRTVPMEGSSLSSWKLPNLCVIPVRAGKLVSEFRSYGCWVGCLALDTRGGRRNQARPSRAEVWQST